MNYEQGFKHAVPPEKKRIFIYNTAHHPTDSPAASARVCVRVWKRGVGVGEEGGLPAPTTNQITKL